MEIEISERSTHFFKDFHFTRVRFTFTLSYPNKTEVESMSVVLKPNCFCPTVNFPDLGWHQRPVGRKIIQLAELYLNL